MEIIPASLFEYVKNQILERKYPVTRFETVEKSKFPKAIYGVEWDH
jgi:hypothetical protein